MRKMNKMLLKMLSMLLASALVLSLGFPVKAASEDQPVLALGSDLSGEQRAAVLGLLGVNEADLAGYHVIYVTNQEEHQYLDAYLSSSVIGTRALSSVLIRPADEGAGLNVTTYNISYCTIDMYTNALLTAGLKDADVYVAAPSNISGTSALIGAVKAYADMTGSSVNEQALETAVNELVVTGELGEVLGDSEAASDMVAYIKQQIAEQGIDSDEDIEALIRGAMEEFDVHLSDEDVAKLVELMDKVSKLDIDVNVLAQQASEIYEKLKDMGLDLKEVDTKQVGNFITRFFDRIVELAESLLGE
mgnify:CR=1 FL=1